MPVLKSPLFLTIALTLFLAASSDAQTRAAPQPADGIRYLEPSYSQNDVDIGALAQQLRRLGVEIPVDVQGKVSFSLKAGIPWNALANGDAYRFDGSLTSPRLVFGPLSLTNFEAKLLYRKGVLSLAPLRFEVRLADTKGAPGALMGSASIDFKKDGLLSAAVELRDIPWADLLEPFLIEGIDLDGRISGAANFKVPIQQMYDPKAMAGTVELRSGSFHWQGLAATGGEVDLTLARGLVTLKRFDVALPVGRVTGTGTLDLTSMKYQAEARIRELSLATAAELAADNLPIAVGGNVNGRVTAAGNLSPLSYSVQGSVAGENLSIGTASGVAVDARFSADSQKVALTQFHANLLGGTVDGSADYRIASGQWQAGVEVAGVSIPQILRELLPKPMLRALEENLRTLHFAQGMEDPLPTEGQLTAKVTASGEAAPLKFAAAGDITANDLTVGREKGVRLDLVFDATEERIAISKLNAAILGGSVNGKAELQQGAGTWNGSLSLERISLARASQFLPREQYVEIAGDAAAELEWKGTLDPLHLQGTGEVRASAVQVQGIEIPQVEVAFAAAGDRIDISKFHAEVLKGQLDGTASIPMDFRQAWRVQVTAKNIELTGLNQARVPIPANLDGRVDAAIAGSLTALARGEGRRLEGNASFRSALLRVDGLPIHQLQGTAKAAGGTVQYEVKAGVLDGRFALAGTAPDPFAENTTAGDLNGSLTLQGVQLAGLSRALGVANRGIAGQIDAALQYSHKGEQLLPEGSGRFEVRGLRYDSRDVARSLQGDVILRDGQLELRNFGGSVFGGTLRTSVTANLREWNGAGLFALTLDQAQLPAIAAFVPSMPHLPGSVRIEARGRLGSEIFAMGTAGIRRTEYESLQVESIQVPFELRYALSTGRGRIAMRESSLHFAGGRVQGSAEIDWYQNYNVSGDLRFYDVHLDSILKQFIGSRQFVSGRISGTATVRGERLNAPTDAAVHLKGQLKQTTAQQLPIIGKLLPYFGSLAAGSPAFDTGSVEAVYTAGKLTVRSLELDGPSLRMKASGTILANGRINLEVMAASGPRSLADRALQAVATKFLVAAVPPLAVVEANELLQDRVVYLVVTGTITAPIVRVRPVPTLGAETIRFFLKGI